MPLSDQRDSSVAVVMPTLNASTFLVEAVRSIASQSLADFTLYIADGGSTDSTVEIAEILARGDPRIVVSRQESKPATRVDRIVHEGAHDLAFIAHADDVSLPERLSVQIGFMRANPDVIVSGTGTHFWLHSKTGIDVHHYSGERTYPDSHERIRCRLPFWWCFSTPSVVFNAGLMREHRVHFDEDLGVGADWLSFWECSRYGRVANLPDLLVSYRHHLASDGANHRSEIGDETRIIRTRIAREAGFWDALDDAERETFLSLRIAEDQVGSCEDGRDYDALFHKLASWNGRARAFDEDEWARMLADYAAKIGAWRTSHDASRRSSALTRSSGRVGELEAEIRDRDALIERLSRQGEEAVARHEHAMREGAALLATLTRQGEDFVRTHEEEIRRTNAFIEELTRKAEIDRAEKDRRIAAADAMITSLSDQGAAFVRKHEEEIARANDFINGLASQGADFVRKYEHDIGECHARIVELGERNEALQREHGREMERLQADRDAATAVLLDRIRGIEDTAARLSAQIARPSFAQLRRGFAALARSKLPMVRTRRKDDGTGERR